MEDSVFTMATNTVSWYRLSSITHYFCFCWLKWCSINVFIFCVDSMFYPIKKYTVLESFAFVYVFIWLIQCKFLPFYFIINISKLCHIVLFQLLALLQQTQFHLLLHQWNMWENTFKIEQDVHVCLQKVALGSASCKFEHHHIHILSLDILQSLPTTAMVTVELSHWFFQRHFALCCSDVFFPD